MLEIKHTHPHITKTQKQNVKASTNHWQ